MKLTSFIITLMISPTLTEAEPVVGMTGFTDEAAHHPEPISSVIWYPSIDGGTVTRAAENAELHGIDVQQDGPQSEGGKLQVVVLSHRLGGNWRSFAWRAGGLAGQGSL